MKFTVTHKRKRKKGLFSKLLVIFVIAQVLIYTYVNMYLSYKVSIEISPTLTTCFFAFFGFEVGLLGHIKTTKIKKGDKNDKSDTGSDCSDRINISSDNDVSDSIYQNEDN